MTDIVERLRAASYGSHGLKAEAADEIERLRKEVPGAVIAEENGRLVAENERLRKENKELRAALTEGKRT